MWGSKSYKISILIRNRRGTRGACTQRKGHGKTQREGRCLHTEGKPDGTLVLDSEPLGL